MFVRSFAVSILALALTTLSPRISAQSRAADDVGSNASLQEITVDASRLPPAATAAPSEQASGPMEEVTVRGQSRKDLRLAIEAAEVRMYDIFNDLSSDDLLEIHCDYQVRLGSRMRRRVCTPNFSAVALERSAWDMLEGDGNPMKGIGWGHLMNVRLKAEMSDLIRTKPELFEAIVDHYNLEQERAGLRRRQRDRD